MKHFSAIFCTLLIFLSLGIARDVELPKNEQTSIIYNSQEFNLNNTPAHQDPNQTREQIDLIVEDFETTAGDWDASNDGQNGWMMNTTEYNSETTKVVSFINDMANAYSIADLIVCRSGAITLSEITTCGKPSILIPFAAAAENHQLKNAKTLLDAGASSLIEEKDLISNILYKKINSLLNDKERLKKMSLAAKKLSKPDAATNIAKLSLEIGFNV